MFLNLPGSAIAGQAAEAAAREKIAETLAENKMAGALTPATWGTRRETANAVPRERAINGRG
jgi:hypothetical protein